MADLLHCQLLNVAGRMYRVYGQLGGNQRSESHSQGGNCLDSHQEHQDQGYSEGEDCWEAEDDPSICADGAGFVCRIDVDVEILPFIIGSKGRTKQRIEADTGARLVIPRKDSSQTTGSSEVLIKGEDRRAVGRAKTQTELVISEALNGSRLGYNCFLSLPLATPATQQQVEGFKKRVLQQEWAAEAGLEESLFMKTAHLHLTLAMLKLYSDSQRQTAQQVLQSLAPTVRHILQEGPLQIQLKGLEYMNDDPSQIHVMYLGVRDPPNQQGAVQRLQQLCSAVVDAFGEAGLLLTRDKREVKLHATVLNTRYRQQTPGTARQAPQPGVRKPFDGRWLLDNFKDVDLGVVQLPAVHLSQRGTYGPDGYYLCADSLAL